MKKQPQVAKEEKSNVNAEALKQELLQESVLNDVELDAVSGGRRLMPEGGPMYLSEDMDKV